MKHWSFSIIAIQLFVLSSCHADLPQLSDAEDNYYSTTSQQLQEEHYTQQIETFYQQGTEGSFVGEDDVIIYYKIFLQQQPGGAAIMISSGRSEAAIKYKELIFDLHRNGYSVYIHDHRGQGQSGRLVEDSDMGYIDSFQFYINDMKTFHDRYARPNQHEKVFLLAHSMGGAIGMTYLEQHPGDFNAAAFSSPMLGLKWYVCPLAWLLRNRDAEYGPGQSGYNREEDVFEGNIVTGSEIRFRRALSAYDQVPEARLGGASVGWARSACEQFGYIFEHAGNIDTPFILFSAGNEQLVNPQSHMRFIKKALQQGVLCQAYRVEDTQHELFMEKDQQRSMVLNASLTFFSEY
jgi:lysophospholipase